MACAVIMSEEGDKGCPLCAEEMDLTDQQLKPCKCGYEICVWCWHHIMDMAEKDQTQGRCPACRTPYNKEKIVGTAAKCEKLVAQMNMEKKMKPQKTKSKISDGRKQLGSVRVIQRSLVYIVGLPLNMADENFLQHRNYFGQYGKVLKVSISRTAAGSIQQFANSTCSVYITYSKEEEAVRCIQSVHGFVLDDKPLKACFGTTKYCHAWLRNMPCSNPDCLYLHEFGTLEDSFTKDEIISAYTRNRVQQITGATSNMQCRSGIVLPPPADECCISSPTLTGKPMSKSASNNVATSGNGFPPNSSSCRSAALPSASSWGALASNGNLPSGNIACSDGPSRKKPETCSGSVAFSTAVAATVQVPCLRVETKKKLIDNEDSQNKPHKGGQELLKNSRQHSCTDNITAHEAPVNRHSPPLPKDKWRCISTAPTETISVEFAERTCSPFPEYDVNVSAQGNNDKLCSGIESIKITRLPGADYSGDNRPDSSFSAIVANSSVNQGLQQCYLEDLREPSKSVSLSNAVTPTDDSQVPKDQSGLRQGFLARRQSETVPDLQTVGAKSDLQVAIPGGKQHFQSLEENKLSDSEFAISTSYFSAPSLPLLHSNFSGVHSPKQTQSYGSSSLVLDAPIVDNVNNGLLHPWDINYSYANSDRNFEHADLKKKLIGRSEGEAANAERSDAADKGESNITSNSLSLDFDPWEEPLISSQNSVELLGEKGKSQGPLAISNSCKAQNSNRSRFSFARPDEYGDLPSNVEPSFSHMQQVFEDIPLSHDLAVNRDINFDKFGDCNGFSAFNTVELDNDARSYSHLSSNKFSGLRSQVSAPPGFSIPNKAPSLGFTSQERMGPNFDAISGNHFPDASSLLRNPYQPPQTGNIGCSTDIKFLDPAILAVGKGRFPVGFSSGVGLNMSSNFSPLLNAVENEARFQSLMQRSSPLVQNLNFSGTGINFSPMNNTHNHLHSRIMEQSLASNLSPFSHFSLQQPGTSMLRNGQWNGWNEGKNSGDIGTELLRTESLGLNKFYGGYEDLNFHMPSSGHAYNGTYGI